MKFLIAFAAILAVSAAVYVTPAHHAVGYTAGYTPYAFGAHHLYKRGIYAAAPVATYHGAYSTPYAAYGAHHLYKRGIYAPVAYHGAYSTPYATYGAHHLYKRGIYAAPAAAYTHGAYSHGAYATPYTFGAHHLYKRGVFAAAYPATPVTHTAYNTPYATHHGHHYY